MARTVNFWYIFGYVTPYLGTKFGTWRNYKRTRPRTNIFSTYWHVYQKKGRVPHHVPIFSVHTGVFGAGVPNNLTAYNSAYRKFWLWIAVFRYTLLYTTRNTGTYWFAYQFQKGEPLLSRRIGLVNTRGLHTPRLRSPRKSPPASPRNSPRCSLPWWRKSIVHGSLEGV